MKKLMLLAAVAAMSVCAFAAPKTKVNRVSGDTVVDLDGFWNDSDVRQVCETLIEDCVSSPRVAKFEDQNGRAPVVIIGKIKNESSERIDTSIVAKRLQTAILNTGVLEFVASAGERQALREEKADQDNHSSLDTAKSMDQEEAADFMLTGSVKTQVQKDGKYSVRTYFVYITLTNIETNRIMWQGENSDIKKIIKNQKGQ